MTVRKHSIVGRPPAYVSRETGAAELGISPSSWDAWVKAGVLPPAAQGFPESTPRWRWADVDSKLSGRPVEKSAAAVETPPYDPATDPGLAAAKNWRDGYVPGRRRGRKPKPLNGAT